MAAAEEEVSSSDGSFVEDESCPGHPDCDDVKSRSAKYKCCSTWRGLKTPPPGGRDFGVYFMFTHGDPSPSDWSKLHSAVWNDDIGKVTAYVSHHQFEEPEVLLQTGKFGETALQLALRLQRPVQMIRLLLRGKGREAVNMGLKDYSSLVPKNLLAHGNEYFPLHEAMLYDDDEEALEVTRLLLEKGADANRPSGKGLLPIEMAAIAGRDAIMRLLLQHGAVLREEALFQDQFIGSAQVLEFLFENFPDSAERHRQALLLVVRRGYLEAIKVCFGAGVRLSAQEAKEALASVGKEPGDFPFVKAPDWPQKMKSIKNLVNVNGK